MKKVILVTALSLCAFLNVVFAQKSGDGIGLKVENWKYRPSNVPERIVSKARQPLLNLPKVNNPTVAFQQKVFYSQSFYPQSSQNMAWDDHNKLMNRQLLETNNMRDLFAERLFEAALVKIFGID